MSQNCALMVFIATGALAAVSGCGDSPERYGIELGASKQALSIGLDARQLRLREVDEYQRNRSVGWHIVDSLVTPSGQIIDYVSAETLYPDAPDAPFATPPFEITPTSDVLDENGEILVSTGATEIEEDPALRPPPGTVPVLREQFLSYVEDGDDYHSLQEFLASLELPANEAASGHLYGLQRNTVTNTDANAYINLWVYPNATNTNDMSLMQLAESCNNSVGVVRETVEAGFQLYDKLYGDYNLHLFTFFTSIGYSDPGPYDYMISYNLMKAGFVQVVGAPTFPGAAFSSSQTSTYNGTQKECLIEYTLGGDGNWWLYACSGWIGYYPTPLSTTKPPSQQIDFDDLDTGACTFSFFGETVTHRGTSPVFWGPTYMGRAFPSDGYKKAAYIRNPQYYNGAWHSMANAPFRSTSSGSGYDGSCYQVGDIVANLGTGVSGGFFVGGIGNSASGCN